MPKMSGWPAALAASTDMWTSMNSSFTAAYRFQLGRSVVRAKVGTRSPTATNALGIDINKLIYHAHPV